MNQKQQKLWEERDSLLASLIKRDGIEKILEGSKDQLCGLNWHLALFARGDISKEEITEFLAAATITLDTVVTVMEIKRDEMFNEYLILLKALKDDLQVSNSANN